MKNNYPVALCFLVFCVGALIKFDVTLIARVPLGELLAFGAIPFLLKDGQLSRVSHRFTQVFWVLMLWIIGIILSDYFNGFIFLRFIRAFMKPLFCGLWMLFFVGVILRDYRLIIFYPLGNVLASVQNYLAPQSFNFDYIESGGYEAVAYGVLPVVSSICLAIAVLMYQKSRLWALLAFVTNATILAAIGAPRSATAIAIFNAGIIFYIWWTRSARRKTYQLTMGRLIIFSILVIIGCLATYYAYIFVAGKGWLGELQYAKLTMQQNTIFGSSPLGLILGGRTYVFAAILGIIDQPLLGHGSWTGVFMSDYYYEAVSMVGTNAADLQRLAGFGNSGMAGHSILFQGWLENGILTALSICVIAYWVAREFLLSIQRDNRITPFVVALSTSFAWAFLFSPFGVGTRVMIGLFFAFHVLKFHEQSDSVTRAMP